MQQILLIYRLKVNTLVNLLHICTRIRIMRFIITLLITVAFTQVSWASPDTTVFPQKHFLFNKKVDDAQVYADMLDKKKDSFLKLTKNNEINIQVTDAIFRKIDLLQVSIENNPKLKTTNDQIRELRYLTDLVYIFSDAVKARQLDPVFTPILVKSFEQAMNLDIDSASILPVIRENSYAVGNLINAVFKSNKGYEEGKKELFLKYCAINPSKILEALSPFAGEPFADSLLVVSAYRNPTQLYNYASAKTSPVGRLIHKSSNPLVKTIATLSQTENALYYFPFLDGILKGNTSMDSIARFIGKNEGNYDSVGYFKLLVNTEIAYTKMLMAKDTPIAMFGPNGLRDMLRRKDSLHFINEMNTLHNAPENIRMRSVEKLSSVDLYYVIVMGENDIYTSSYVKSFTRLIQRLGTKPRTDSLLEKVGYDQFKKFIKMAANFNTLDTFLKLMPAEKADQLMKYFVSGLENTPNLEDAVDVADSYSGIKNKVLQQNILSYIGENEVKAEAKEDVRGKTIYNLLKMIFLSSDTTAVPRVDLTKSFGIPSVYETEYNYLKDDSGRITEIMFFYGDKDGIGVFGSFLNTFDPKKWKITPRAEWVEISSLKNNKLTIYANRPLNNDQNLDDTAQIHLLEYLRKMDISPTIVVHRGHSYWLPRTINRMPDDARIIVLGSCGGYKNLSQIIRSSPNASIVSTKQIGTGSINKEILNSLHRSIFEGSNISWPAMWATLTKYFYSLKTTDIRETWNDYIPPYKNLGSIFLKAYNKKMQDL
jgi:hypothetical protein